MVISALPIKHPIVILALSLDSVFTSCILNIQPRLYSYALHLQTLIFSMAVGRFPLGTLNRDRIGNRLSWSNYKAGLFNFVWWEFICLTPNLTSLHINAIKTIGSDSILASHIRTLYLIKNISQVKYAAYSYRNASAINVIAIKKKIMLTKGLPLKKQKNHLTCPPKRYFPFPPVNPQIQILFSEPNTMGNISMITYLVWPLQ